MSPRLFLIRLTQHICNCIHHKVITSKKVHQLNNSSNLSDILKIALEIRCVESNSLPCVLGYCNQSYDST